MWQMKMVHLKCNSTPFLNKLPQIKVPSMSKMEGDDLNFNT